jgi:hypothetical protein
MGLGLKLDLKNLLARLIIWLLKEILDEIAPNSPDEETSADSR